MIPKTRRLATFAALHLLASVAGGHAAEILEGEALKVLERSGEVAPQDLRPFGEGSWSGNAQLWWTGGKPGDAITLAFSVPADGTYRLGAGLTKAIDYGIASFLVDGRDLTGPLDFFHDGVIHGGTVALGQAVRLKAGGHRLTIRLDGANPAAIKSHMVGLDYLVVDRDDEGDLATLGPKLKALPAKVKADGLKSGNAEEAAARTAAAQQAAFTVPDGFTVELVASEESGLPKPAMAAFDDAGRLWSVTATAYPRDQDPGIWQRPGPDRVVVLDAPLGKGPHVARTFAEGMVMPLSVLPEGDGAYVAQGPEILYLGDRDGDGKADSRKVLMKGFGVQDTHTLPHQLTRMPGGRIVFSQGVLNNGKVSDASGRSFDFNKTLVASMKPDGSDARIIGAGLNNIWAWAHGRTGRVFFHEANDFGYSLIPFEEDTSYPSFIATKLHPDSPLHPPTAEGLNLGGTGFSGLAICDDRSGSFPAPWQGLFYVANPILGKIHAVRGTLGANGVWAFEKAGDLVSCADPMFRPVAITFGPDGCLYITDWYNRIISHNEVARDHPARDKERGRIWRIRHAAQPPARVTDLTKVPSSELPARLAAASTWEMRAAWHQIGRRQARETVPALVALVGDRAAATDTRIHALWSLEDLGHFDAALWPTLLGDPSPDLRREAVRALSSLRVPEDRAFPLLQPLAGEAAWTVRYEVLRYFRRAAGPVNPAHVGWLRRWSAEPAPQIKAGGWGGPFLALGGSYERAFQDFLLQLAATKTSAALAVESPWDKTLAREPAPGPEQAAALARRHAGVKAALAGADPAAGRALVDALCLGCHSIAGKGAGFAPPLDGSAQRDLDGLLTAILAPDAAAENVFRLYRVVKKDGGIIEGFKRGEDARELTLLAMGGTAIPVPIAEIREAGYLDGRSMMPDLTAGMSPEVVGSIVAYLRTVK